MFVTVTAGPNPVVETARPALEAIWLRLSPHLNGAYANFLASATEQDVAAIYPTETYERLAAVKRQYDPGNLFARNHNVRPHTSDGAYDNKCSSARDWESWQCLSPE
jgi:Berberine and berberine like